MDVRLDGTVSFGDDLIDIGMMTTSETGRGGRQREPEVIKIADEICPPNNDDGVAQWIERHLLA